MTLPYRDGVGVMLINRDKRVFVAKRIDTVSEAWQMPQGGIDVGEEPRAAALRELAEETGVTQVEVLRESPRWHHYDLPGHLIPKIWGGKYRGQRQKWFALRFLGVDGDINLETAHPEFCAWQWSEASRLPQLIVPFKRVLYETLVEEFGDLL